MPLYAESSAVLRWLFNEERGDEVFRLLRTADKVTCSRLTLVECRRVISRAGAGAGLSEKDAAGLRGVLAQAASRWAILEVTSEVARRAEERFPAEPLRTLDALHLASALVLNEAAPGLAVLTTDDRIRSNAVQLGFSTLPEG
ncbi:MAG: type II toxin-antitoxin system VapC family toxin [Deltaproteobacteria bacterium]|nr:type II toxin-antitoxin system VapC family toxin [Deltaproteobacteria bacterium]